VVSPNGSKRKFNLRYTKPTTKKPNVTLLGYFPEISYPEARERIASARKLLAQGIDPVQHKKDQQVAGMTFKQVFEEFKQSRKGKWRSTRNIDTQVYKHLKPFLATPVASITSALVKQTLQPCFEQYPDQAHRTINTGARVIDYATAMKYFTGDNPFRWRRLMEYLFPLVRKETKHYASLPFKYVPEFIRQLNIRRYQGASASALELLILTGSRPGEIIGMRWSEIDPINRTWTIPAARYKTSMEHRVPLSERCMEILQLRMEYRINDFVFTGYNQVEMDPKALRMLIAGMDVRVTPSGFRKSFRNWVAHTFPDNPNSRDLAEISLGHVVKGKVEGAYWTDDMLEQRRAIMSAWALYCLDREATP
jgi:integrase